MATTAGRLPARRWRHAHPQLSTRHRNNEYLALRGEFNLMVTIDADSAARLAAEGALCLDADTGLATRNGAPCTVPDRGARPYRPILVSGTSLAATEAIVEQLERRGHAAWLVKPASTFTR